MRYTLTVRADRKDVVEAVISKLPSHYITAWVAETEEGTVQYSEPTNGARKVQLPVGQLASLVAVAHEEGTKPTHYICSGEYNDEQLKSLKRVLQRIRLTKNVDWWEDAII